MSNTSMVRLPDSLKEDEFEEFGYKKPSVCSTKRIIIAVVIIAVVILILGLALGLGLKKSPPVNTEGCKPFPKSEPTRARTKGETWLKQDCSIGDKPECPAGYSKPPLLIISMDGFRANYMDRNLTPVLEKIAECGVHPEYMRPAFPSKTFPNHYSIVTGLYPESHGIIDNLMYDMEIDEVFTLGGDSKFDPRWWHGEPIWVSARKADKISATMFWPGSETKIDGTYPSMCFWYDKSVLFENRVDQVLAWLDMPETTRPDVITAYFDQPDGAGHQQGPFGEWVKGNLTRMDNIMGDLMDSLISRKLDKCIDIILLSDHGMTPTSCKHVVDIQKPLKDLKVFTYDGTMGRVTSKYIAEGDKIVKQEDGASADELVKRLECTHYNTTSDYNSRVYKKEDLPLRAHYAVSPRIEEVVVTAKDEWLLRGNFLGDNCDGGNHGYDNIFESMKALFMAYGSSFKQKYVPEPFENVEVYNLMADILGVPNAPNNGTSGRLHDLLRHPPTAPTPPTPATEYTSPVFPDLEERERRRQESDCKCQDIPDVDKVDKQLDLTVEETEMSIKEHLPSGVPILEFEGGTLWKLAQKAYVSAYSKQHHMPVWSAFTLTDKEGSITNTTVDCARVDVRLPPEGATKCAAYTNEQGAISATYLFPPGLSPDENVVMDARISSNIVPMYDGFREGAWENALKTVIQYRTKYKKISVMAGPVFDFDHNGLYDDPTTFTEFVDAAKTVPVPTHYYMVLTKCPDDIGSSCSPGQRDVMATVLRHKPTVGNCWEQTGETGLFKHLQNNVARTRDVELVTGMGLFGDVTGNPRVTLLTELTIGLWPLDSWLDGAECDVISAPNCPAGYSQPPVLLISLDGFRPDYLQRNVTPVLEKFKRCGVSAPYMQSIYPSLTFPNHYSVATGLYPESHGIVDNSMYDQVLKENFYLGSPNAANPKWWGGEPIWNTVVRQNKTSTVYYWPGSDVEIGGMRPTRYETYNGDTPHTKRVDQVLQWLKGEDELYPEFLMLYIEEVDKAGHEGGPASGLVTEALGNVDGYLKELMDGLKRHKLDQCVNIVITSDHGMSDMSCDRSIGIKGYTDESMDGKYFVYNGAASRLSNQYTRKGYDYKVIPKDDRVTTDQFVHSLSCQTPYMNVYKNKELPKRYHYAYNDRIENVTMVITDTWLVSFDKPWCPIKGQHGWDPMTYDSMKALFQAWGPSFKSQQVVQAFENIELYNLLTKIVGVDPAPNNGTEGSLYHLLRDPPNLEVGQNNLEYIINKYPDEEYEQRANDTDCTCDAPKDKTIKELDERLNLTSTEQKDLEKQHLPSGRPYGERAMTVSLLYHKDYVSAYSSNYSMPLWTAFTLGTQTDSLTSVQCLRPDVRLESLDQPTCTDLNSPDFLTNHFFPPAFSSSQEAMFDALLLTNVVPMMNNFAAGVWSTLLSKVKSWADQTKQLQVITGPVFDYDADGKADDVSNVTVKLGSIPVPSHFFMVALHCPTDRAGCDDMDYDTQAFVVEHRRNVTNCQSYEDYIYDHRARLRDIELLTGLEFLTAKTTTQSIQSRLQMPRDFGFTAR